MAEIVELVIFCGKKGRVVSRHLLLKHRLKYVYIGHPGLRGESIVASDRQTGTGGGAGKKKIQAENTAKRLAVLVAAIVSQLEAGDASGCGGTR